MAVRSHRLLVPGALLAVLIGGCAPATTTGDGGAGSAAGTPAPVVSAPASSPSSQPAPAASSPADAGTRQPPPDLSRVRVALEPYVQLDAPTAIAVRPDDDALYIAERAGRVLRVIDGDVTGTVLDISDQTTVDAERGLLGVTFAPDGETLFASFTTVSGESQVVAYPMGDTAADAAGGRTLLTVAQPFANHNGGHVVTGPDGLLYLGLGDGGSGGDPLGSGQDVSTLLGGLVRIDPTPSDGRPYSIPDDNPFVGRDGRDELWAYGLRNPWRFSFDRETDDLWVADVGQNQLEEITRVPFASAAGTNFGWNVSEGTQRFSDGEAPGAVPPLFEYPHDGRCSVTGGYVYRGDQIAGLQGAYVFGDFCDGQVRALTFDGARAIDSRPLDAQVPALVSFGEDAAGELYVVSLEGTVYRLTSG